MSFLWAAVTSKMHSCHTHHGRGGPVFYREFCLNASPRFCLQEGKTKERQIDLSNILYGFISAQKHHWKNISLSEGWGQASLWISSENSPSHSTLNYSVEFRRGVKYASKDRNEALQHSSYNAPSRTKVPETCLIIGWEGRRNMWHQTLLDYIHRGLKPTRVTNQQNKLALSPDSSFTGSFFKDGI